MNLTLLCLDVVEALEVHWRHLVRPMWAKLRPHFSFYDSLFIERSILAVSEPAEPIINLSVPWCFCFPLDFLNIFDRIESEIDFKTALLASRVLRLRLELHSIEIYLTKKPVLSCIADWE